MYIYICVYAIYYQPHPFFGTPTLKRSLGSSQPRFGIQLGLMAGRQLRQQIPEDTGPLLRRVGRGHVSLLAQTLGSTPVVYIYTYTHIYLNLSFMYSAIKSTNIHILYIYKYAHIHVACFFRVGRWRRSSHSSGFIGFRRFKGCWYLLELRNFYNNRLHGAWQVTMYEWLSVNLPCDNAKPSSNGTINYFITTLNSLNLPNNDRGSLETRTCNSCCWDDGESCAVPLYQLELLV